MPLSSFHPAVADWFKQRFVTPSAPQREGWPTIARGEHTLIAAPTGTGKTLSAFLCAIDDLVRRAERGELKDETLVLYVSPLKALSNDIEKNLQEPLQGIEALLQERGHLIPPIQTAVRTGDTPASERTRATKKPPHIFVTTPESLYILLTSKGGRRMLSTVRTVIVDEIHALVRDKRGAHLALSLERLDALVGTPVTRIGLSATQRPIEEVARFLVGTKNVAAAGQPKCNIVDVGHQRELDVALELPDTPLSAVMSLDTWEEIYTRLAQLIEAHRTTLIFVNTRRLAERVTANLSELVGEDAITSHHGSLARKHRLQAEQRLKAGEFKALVATASLELGIDIGEVDLVCQIGSPHSVATFLQRVGRSGHHKGGVPKGRLFPLSRDDLVECTALLECVARGELDEITQSQAPLDILAQQIVASVAAETTPTAALFALAKNSWPYRELTRERFDEIVKMLSEGFATQRGRRAAYLHHDAVKGVLKARRGARLTAITNGGAIPDNFDYEVRLQPQGLRIGSLNEDFAIESMAGDIFQLGNLSYEILRVETGVVHVADAQGKPPSLPFWLGEAPSRSDLLSHAVHRLRQEVHGYRDQPETALNALKKKELSTQAAEQLSEYLISGDRALGAMPTQETIVLERFFDEAGSMHMVLHAPFGSRLNRAWGLALRKRFCRSFNVELQAAATEDAVVLSLGPTHSFPLEEVFEFLHPNSVREVLVQALLDAPMFQTRWRWNATRALAIHRFRGGKKVAPQLQRIQSDDLLALCFPDQVACLENVRGDREIPDHPLVAQTIDDCLHEAMDIDKLCHVLGLIYDKNVLLKAINTTEPSPFSQEILNAKPYAFLDDAPLEERRTQAVMSRRWLDQESAADLGQLNPDAIARVRGEAAPDPRDSDELHDALLIHNAIPENETLYDTWPKWLEALIAEGRATVATTETGTRLWIACERIPLLRAAYERLEFAHALRIPESLDKVWEKAKAQRELIRGRLEAIGPTTANEISTALGLVREDVEAALRALEHEGSVLQGQYRSSAESVEWCDRRLLARIHRYTIHRLRNEIQPVAVADYLRFLFGWQHLSPDTRLKGPAGLSAILEQLDGFEAGAGAWESDILPVRMNGYDPSWLDQLCLAGQVMWLRRRAANGTNPSPIRSTPIALVQREHEELWKLRDLDLTPNSAAAQEVLKVLRERGASFFTELVRASGLLRTHAEAALGELVALGLVNSDGFQGLRALLVPEARRQQHQRQRKNPYGVENAGRWYALEPANEIMDLEAITWSLLKRWGVVFRRTLDLENEMPPWRDLLRTLRRLEAQGKIRGGRFIDQFSGEQFALPEAVGALREMRRKEKKGELIAICATDPLNVTGILLPCARVTASTKNRILFRDGVPIAVREKGETSFLTKVEEPWPLEKVLTQRQVPPEVRAYLGN